ncbi:MAG: ABC transporter ATP-binding protein [candidate division WOR-3 bacterium]|jgi:iron complex transport system ATP-binding protein
MNAIELRQVSFGYQQEKLFHNFSLVIEAGDFLGIVGPNGSGKSTLLKLIARIVIPWAGEINVLGKNLNRLTRREIARMIAFVPQESYFAFDWTVEDVVMMGRNPYRQTIFQPSARDREIVSKAMGLTGVIAYRQRNINAISAGERQLVIIARALAQEPAVLLLDEATSHLDLFHRVEILRVLISLRQQKKTIVAIYHDLNEAINYCSRLAFLKSGTLLACGEPDKLNYQELIRAAYGIEPVVDRHPVTGRPQIFLPAELQLSAEQLL